MKRYPSPNINFMPIKPLTDDLFNGLLGIYERTKTYKTSFEVAAFEGTIMSWPETDEDHQWILDNILKFYNIEPSEIQSLEYTANDTNKELFGIRNDSIRQDWGFKNVPSRIPNSLNFTTVTRTSIITAHNDHEAGCKINIPIRNMSAANIYFQETDEKYFYPAPALINCPATHEVQNLSRMTTFDIPERTFFQIVCKGSYEFYKATLPLPNGY